MPTFLLNPIFLRWTAILVIGLSLFTTGFVKGLHYEHDRFAVEQAKLVEKQLETAAKLNKDLSAQLIENEAQKVALIHQKEALSTQVVILTKSRAKYHNSDCSLDDDVLAKLREAAK